MTLPTMNEQERQDYLAQPHIGTLSVASGSARPPLTVPVFYAYEPGGDVTFFTNTQGRKSRKVPLIEKAGVASMSVQTSPPPKYVTVECTLVKVDDQPSADQLIAIARRYMPLEEAEGFAQGELGFPDRQLVVVTLRPDRWLSTDMSKA